MSGGDLTPPFFSMNTTIKVITKRIVEHEEFYHVEHEDQEELIKIAQILAAGRFEKATQLTSTYPNGTIRIQPTGFVQKSNVVVPIGLLGPEPTVEVTDDKNNVLFTNGMQPCKEK